MLSKTLSGAAMALLASKAYAVTSITDSNMTALLNAGGLDLALAYAPLWFFGQAMNQPPCIPDWAFGGSPTQNDTYDPAHMTPTAPQCNYPDVGCGCRNPGTNLSNPTPPFPVYYNYLQCNASEIRVSYNLFYQKDGAEVLGVIDTGHNFDWERMVIIHTKNTANNSWAPSQALYSYHSSYNRYNWGDIQNTLTTDQIAQGDALNPNGVQDQDHPKAYIAWSKHDSFDDRNTGWNDPISQSDGNAFRSDDWWYYVPAQYYIRADNSTAAGQATGAANWGSATSNPLEVYNSLCQQ